MSLSKNVFDKIKKVITANVYKSADDVYNSEGIGLSVRLFSNSIMISINTDSRKLSANNIINENEYMILRRFSYYLQDKYNIDVDKLNGEAKQLFIQLNEELSEIGNEIFYVEYDDKKYEQKSIEYSKILSAIVKSFLIEEVEQVKHKYAEYQVILDEKAQQLIKEISNQGQQI